MLLGVASSRHRFAFCSDAAQVHWFRSKVVDVDDPAMTPEEAAFLRRSNVAACVVTAESVARQMELLGLEKPYHHVVPQPVRLDLLDQASVPTVAATRGRVQRTQATARKEKELTHTRDALAEERSRMAWLPAPISTEP